MAFKKKYAYRDVFSLLHSYPGRVIVRHALSFKLWPLAQPAAKAYRRYAVPETHINAVTGSFGKTTASRALAAILGEAPHHSYRNNLCYLALNLMKIRPGQKTKTFEVGVAGFKGLMARQADMLRPDLVVVTSIGGEHNTAFKTIAGIREEKALIFKYLHPESTVVINGDDENVRLMAQKAPCRVVSFGFDPDNDIRAEEVELDWPHGTRFLLLANGQKIRLRVRSFGKHIISNLLSSVAAAISMGVSLERIAARLESLPPVEARMQPVELPSGAWLLRDDFKSTQETIDTALDFLAQVPGRRKMAVLGSISELNQRIGPAYREYGQQAGEACSRILYLGFAAKHFQTGAKRSGIGPHMVTNCHRSVKKALEILQDELEPGDVVLLKGRGSQHLARVALGLTGRKVGCDLAECGTPDTHCNQCPKLETGWADGRQRI